MPQFFKKISVYRSSEIVLGKLSRNSMPHFNGIKEKLETAMEM